MEKILKNEIFLRTVIYIIGLLVFFSYWYLLGTINAFVGVTVVKGSLTLLNKDLTANPVKNTVVFLFAFLYIGIFSFLGSLNIYVGFFINFFALFFLTYNFVSDLNISIWIPFVLGYLYLLVKPVPYYDMPKRLLALGAGSLFMIFSQLILNKNKSKAKLQSNFSKLLDNILNKIEILKGGKVNDNKKFKSQDCLENITSTIYNRRTSFFYIDDKDSILLNLMVCLERLEFSIKEIKINSKDKCVMEFLKDLSDLINKMKTYIKEDNPTLDLISEIEKFSSKYSKYLKDEYSFYDIIQNLDMLKFSLTNLMKYTNKKEHKLKTMFSSFNKFKIKNLLKYNFKKSIKFTYAFRLSFLLALSYFLVEALNIPEGKWITFTIFTVVQPYMEDTKKRFGKRFKGTVVGIILFSLIDIFIKDAYLKIAIFALLYYIYALGVNYTLKSVCTTTVGIGVFSMITGAPISGGFYRFIFMGAGIVIGYLGTIYIFPYSLKDSIINLSKEYYNISFNMFYKGLKEKINLYFIDYINRQLLLSKLFESKIVVNNSTCKLKDVNDFIYNERFLNNDIYFLFFIIFESNGESDIFLKIKNIIISSFNINNESVSIDLASLVKFKNNMKPQFNSILEEEDKLIFITIYRIICKLEKADRLASTIERNLVRK
ncbi:FUSC family protein [Eubacterium multiforme]|uniref:Integral membrane bound transporter domain-containing protein n=1 Tax=Eubacterium multiforme TaxID=83339 RepID=A0ABT9UQE1_9FIRM|nr:FUSC family protein [Eubacterium multiforme]MDQ0148183.1 hypothetical protein [Eubacterium multiforme]